jgi:biotin carboxylase
MKTVVIVAGCQSYRTADFVAAATLLRLDTLIATDAAAPIVDTAGHIEIDLSDPAGAAAQVATAAPDADAVVAVDDEGVQTAALAAEALGLVHNAPEAVAATRDKLAMRRLLAAAGVPQPDFAAADLGEVPEAATRLGYPVVVKPTGLSASRGVIRIDGAVDAARAEARIRAILGTAGHDPDKPLLVERYVPGDEVVIEGLLIEGELQVLAVIDKPDPLEGPFFEETMFVTPSRLPDQIQQEAVALAADAAAAIGLTTGPVHAEVRIPPTGPAQLIEIAARSIGGLCGRSLSFGLLGESLEVVILRSALGIAAMDTEPAQPATGVLMLPIPASGTFTGVENADALEAISGITGVTITIPKGRAVLALPEGDRYLGFVFAEGLTADTIEESLRHAAATLVVTIDGEELRSEGIAAALPE